MRTDPKASGGRVLTHFHRDHASLGDPSSSASPSPTYAWRFSVTSRVLLPPSGSPGPALLWCLRPLPRRGTDILAGQHCMWPVSEGLPKGRDLNWGLKQGSWRRLQTGTRGAFGKPQRTVARVHTGQVIMSTRTKLQNKEHVIEALHRAKFKFPGCQKIHIISKKWGFSKFNTDEFEDLVAENQLIPDGCRVKYIPNRGCLDKWRALHS
ncbi:60S ribosomal protein L10-like [Carlito syrichta]|uniref:60S ribosomal protein L10-like n=1 Tax=Carlito syrichta TaxID=1868482 RepID=A0A3Q0EES0_CARSF|nr:60S ribosomal protein L10-like [Carlito syrichta]